MTVFRAAVVRFAVERSGERPARERREGKR
ncbi:hypothetical protein SAMN04489841_4602 [Natrinema salaciae]|uniref:Uncharacterized protein n=1 Tax=Natrinema salaciae TaxID=1186196 RepID=A0A1H9S8V4_9EURY|nr:hypothetical protein SAMN04489841_4602 [Natrinema salaciae]